MPIPPEFTPEQEAALRALRERVQEDPQERFSECDKRRMRFAQYLIDAHILTDFPLPLSSLPSGSPAQ